MALVSPRFRSSPELVNASNNAPPMRNGSRGRGVHLLQFALIDLGHRMPLSTGGTTSPDGIFGDETERIVRDFQRANNLTVDGDVGPNTLGALDARFPRARHRVRLHFRSLAMTNLPFEQTLQNAQVVYGQYGIDLQFGSGESLMLTQQQTSAFDRIDQQCTWNLSSGEYNALHALGTPCPQNEIKVYYVRALQNNLRGCGGHAPNRPAATVAHSGGPWTTAHEVGHVLLTSGFRPVHHGSRKNLMFSPTPVDDEIKMLTLDQVRRMRQHVCCVAT
ncbi:MAG: peptidoglycan-binding domain-containing protein [Pseudomonadota bacterium]